MPRNLIITAAALFVLGIIIYARPVVKKAPADNGKECCATGPASCLPDEQNRTEEWVPENPARQLIFISSFN